MRLKCASQCGLAGTRAGWVKPWNDALSLDWRALIRAWQHIPYLVSPAVAAPAGPAQCPGGPGSPRPSCSARCWWPCWWRGAVPRQVRSRYRSARRRSPPWYLTARPASCPLPAPCPRRAGHAGRPGALGARAPGRGGHRAAAVRARAAARLPVCGGQPVHRPPPADAAGTHRPGAGPALRSRGHVPAGRAAVDQRAQRRHQRFGAALTGADRGDHLRPPERGLPQPAPPARRDAAVRPGHGGAAARCGLPAQPAGERRVPGRGRGAVAHRQPDDHRADHLGGTRRWLPARPQPVRAAKRGTRWPRCAGCARHRRRPTPATRSAAPSRPHRSG